MFEELARKSKIAVVDYAINFFCSCCLCEEIGGDMFETSSKRGYNVGECEWLKIPDDLRI